MCRFCQILCFVLKNCHNFKSYQNMLIFSSLSSYIISYSFSLNKYIASHLYIIKDSWTLKKTLNFDKHKIFKIWKFECFLDVSNSTLLLQKKLRIKKIVL
jgi:hypothetical protein